MAKDYESRRDEVVARLNAMPGITCAKPSGAFYVFPNVQAYYGKSCGDFSINSSMDMTAYLLEKAHVACVGGEAFMMPGYIRISYAVKIERVIEGLDRIQKALIQLS